MPDDSDAFDLLPCFDFHKFARKKNTAPTIRSKQAVPRNPAAELNPFAPDKGDDLIHGFSENSVCDTASIGSIESLSVNEPDCSSTASVESASSSSENSEENIDAVAINSEQQLTDVPCATSADYRHTSKEGKSKFELLKILGQVLVWR